MRNLKTLTLAVLAAVSISAVAAPKAKKKSKKQEKTEQADTLTIDAFSYQFGRVNSTGLVPYLAQREGVDTTYLDQFIEGFAQTEFTDDDKKQQARLAGIKIRKQVESQILPKCNKSVNDSVDLINHELFLDGFRAGVMNNDQSGVALDSAQKLVQSQLDFYQKRKYASNIEAGEAFLAKNAKADSVKVTASGLQYKVLTEGTGEKPTEKSRVKVNYRGTLLDGTEFDSSYKRNKPSTFGVNQVIKGWSEGLQLMSVGSKYMFYIPYELGYGNRESGSIPPYSMLTFEVELVEIVK